jgi:4-amino-4-deoxy-L-arabinose transferase-like glycosyltransferase
MSLARLGILPFFPLASLFVFLWARKCAGDVAGLIATFLFTTAPPVLTHAGLATTDMAIGAMAPVTLYAFWRSLSTPKLTTWIAFGVAAGLAILSKLTAFLFLGACLPALLLFYLVQRYREGLSVRSLLRARLLPAAVAALFAFFVIWAGYLFSFDTLEYSPSAAGPTFRISVPAPELARGIRDAIHHGKLGNWAYLMGETSQFGWWYFFPIAVGVKTPLPMLLLFSLGIVMGFAAQPDRHREATLAAILCAALIMLVLLPIRINLGVRHILPFYFFLAVIGGCGATWILRGPRRRMIAVTLTGGLLVWQGGVSLLAHPNYLPYFNELAGLTEDPILVDSDRDWGQNVYHLQQFAADRGIERLHVSVMGLGEMHLAALDSPVFVPLDPEIRSGWVAISAYPLYMVNRLARFRQYEPVTVIGDSVYIYHLDEDAATQ